MPRDPRVEKLQQLRTERVTRAAGSYYGTRATAYGNVRSGPRHRDAGRTLLSLLLVVVILAVGLYAASQYILHGYRPATAASGGHQGVRTVTVNIAPGESSSQLAQQLSDKGLVPNSFFFNLYLRATGASYAAGPHTLNTNMSMDEVARAIATVPAIPVTTVTIYPGWRAEQVAEALDEAGVARYADVMNQVKNGKFSYDFLQGRPLGATLEGYLLPDTYQLRKDRDAHYALNVILQNFEQKVGPGVRKQAAQQYGSLFKAIVVASIVQREAGTSHDIGLIASTYLNRIKDSSGQFTKLNADPTVQYALGHKGDWWPNVNNMNLKSVASAFNTYVHPGLPPLPISEPAATTIAETVHPPTTPYFYFWHENGSHGMSIFCTAAQGTKCAGTPQ